MHSQITTATDGYSDIFVANDSTLQFLYHNKGNGTFEEVALINNAAVDGDGRTFAGMGVDFADYNNDGLPDVVVTDLANQMYALYQNSGDGSFNYASLTSGLGQITRTHSGWGVRFFDYDNDGWKDLLIAQGHDLDTIQLTSPNLRYREPMLLARNTGQGFVDVSTDSGTVFKEAWAARGMAIGDIDNDGRIDAVVTTNDGPAYILHNETSNQNHWLALRLVGHKSNRDGIGARVEVEAGGVRQIDEVRSGGSYLSQSDLRLHFGLGAAARVSRITIRWPSGAIDRLSGIPADRHVVIEEGSQSWRNRK